MRRAAVPIMMLLALGRRTAAATDCVALPSPVYVTGSTAAKPLLAEIGKLMANQPTPVTVVYLGQGSCAGVDAILSGTPMVGSGEGAVRYWDKSGVELPCDIAGVGATAHVGISDVFATSCFQLPGGLPASVVDTLGPVQAMTFIAPRSSSERAISAEAAYYVYGFGGRSQVLPWTYDALIFQRDKLSGTQRMVAAAIGVPPERWKGTATSSSSDMLVRIATAAIPHQAIGILAADVAQDNGASIKVLAYQDFGALCAVFPDSAEHRNDKANVRNGQYPIWGPLHLLTRVNGRGYPANANAGQVIGYLSGTLPTPAGIDLIGLAARRHVVPQCAMRVQRAQEVGPATRYSPSHPCGCYYEKLAEGVTTCKACTSVAECPSSAPICSYGYCEPQ